MAFSFPAYFCGAREVLSYNHSHLDAVESHTHVLLVVSASGNIMLGV